MPKLEHPANKNFWIARNADDSVVHIGQTNPDQVTVTGLDELNYTEDDAEHLRQASNYADKFPDLPSEGEQVERDQIYNNNGRAVRCIQSHRRTHRDVTEEPALWTVAKQDYDEWIQPTGAHDAYQAGDIVTYEGQAWISKIDANTTVPDGDEPHNRYWEPYNE